jgi:hypothetical protein
LLCYLALELTDDKGQGQDTERGTSEPSEELVKASFKEKLIASTRLDILGDAGKVEYQSRSNDEIPQNDDDDGEDGGEDDNTKTTPEDSLFIPFGFIHERPRTYYKGSDPEWQSFLEFSKDKKNKKHICSKCLLKYDNYRWN